MTPYVDVQLTWLEIAHAARCGEMRHIHSRIRQSSNRYTADWSEGKSWNIDVLGACGECAVAKATGRYWSGMGTGYDPTADDVVGLQVRHTVLPTGRLILHPADPDETPFVLVTGTDPVFRLQGWIFGREGKRPEWFEDPQGSGRPAYFVSQSELRPMPELLEWLR